MTAGAAAADADLGAHVSAAGGLATAFERAREVGARAVQLFVKNQRQWAARPLAPGEPEAFREAWRASGVGAAVAHATYLVNLAAEEPLIWAKSVVCLAEEMKRAADLGLIGVIVHPGSSPSRERGIARIALGIEKALEATKAPDARLLLENTAGSGGSIGVRFEDLRAILDALPPAIARRVDVCIDTCHLHAAGFEISSRAGYARTIDELAAAIGLARVRVFHVNDSVRERGSRVDRHANLGAGTIGLELFEALVNDARFAEIPKILETPREDGGHERDLALLRSMRAKGNKGRTRPSGKGERGRKA